MPPLKTFSLLVAAAMHDYAHPALSNKFMIGAKADVALQYNDISPLENYHVAQAHIAMREYLLCMIVIQ